jgi:23S rRNA (pseudouridine1915-N3)-methyltransferase
MARELCVVWAGRHQRKPWEELCADYRQRIERFLPVRDVVVRAKGFAAEEPGRKEAEGRALLAAAPASAWLVALDPRGRERSSEELSSWLVGKTTEWPHAVAFLVGSDLGLSAEVLAASRESLSLSRLTLPHELARLVLYEQLYRALSIGAGINYHRAGF